jgi:phage host-nuclease inhibitor protein Gam
MRTAVLLAGCALALGGLAGCGGGEESSAPPDRASTAEFCDAFNELLEGASTASHDDIAAQIKAVKDGAARLEEVGAPAEMPDDARRGFAVFVDAIQEIDGDAELAELDAVGEGMSAADQKDGEAYVTWAQTSCAPTDGAS